MSVSQTRKLATARLEFSGDRRLRNVLHVAAVAAFVVLVIAIGARLYADGQAPGARLAALQQQNTQLRSELARAQTELELERSTRAALTDQVAELNAQAGDLKSQLDFFNAQSGRTARAR
jgi:septal ring factor EnvC (AmiA/AmiB activator)